MTQGKKKVTEKIMQFRTKSRLIILSENTPCQSVIETQMPLKHT